MRISTVKNLRLQSRSSVSQIFFLYDSTDHQGGSFWLNSGTVIFPEYSPWLFRCFSVNLRLFGVNDVIQEFIPHNWHIIGIQQEAAYKLLSVSEAVGNYDSSGVIGISFLKQTSCSAEFLKWVLNIIVRLISASRYCYLEDKSRSFRPRGGVVMKSKFQIWASRYLVNSF